jgi:hypothetical protein
MSSWSLLAKRKGVPYPSWKRLPTIQEVKPIDLHFENFIEKEDDPNSEESKIPDPNMAQAETLGDFVSGSRSKYPANASAPS